MSKKALCESAGQALYENLICGPALPVSFTYDGKRYEGLSELKPEARLSRDEDGKEKTVTLLRLDENVQITVEAAYCEEFGQSEYTVWFRNIGKEPSKVLSDVTCLDMDFRGEDPVLRGCLGDHDKWYEAYDRDLTKGDAYFLSTEGRATHIVFPYFDLCFGGGGVLLALGWAGTWEALFSHNDGKTQLRAKTNLNLNTVLMPGEEVRTGLVVLLPYRGRNADDATNLWREWFMKYNLPKFDATGKPLYPVTTSCFSNDTGLPNSDGSISECASTWKRTLDKLIEEDVVPDFRWFDAGWYFDPEGNTVPSLWWHTIGSWELDTVKWPGKSFLESNEACHKAGARVFVWFEPERVTHLDALCRNYGYKKEWGICSSVRSDINAEVITSNIGDPECLNWTLNRITKMMDENGVDMYREDNNSDPAAAWKILDKRDEEKYGVVRRGINENKCICGHYKLWDGIIDYCAKHGKCTFVDSCASGGGRNDIESMRRGVPMMRSDFDRTTSAMRLSQTSTFCKWIPFHGSATKETLGQLDASAGKGADIYVTRASFLPVFNLHEAFTQNTELDYDLFRRNLNEWKSVNRLLTKDFYTLTPWRHHTYRKAWTAFAYNDEETGEAVLLAFRMEEAEKEESTFFLPFAKAEETYFLKNADTQEETCVPGAELIEKGITIRLTEKRSSAMITIHTAK